MSEASSSSPISVGDYAPSPNTCSMALTRANQLRIQALLRQLLVSDGDHPKRLDTLRVLRRTIREFDYNLSWLTQVDFLETIERLLSEENQQSITTTTVPGTSNDDDCLDDWRLINDSTQLLIESIPRLPHEIDAQTISQILSSAIQNLGHQRSEVRRASLLLLNMYINERPAHFQQFLKLFIDYGLANHRNAQAQKGAILSLPLLMTEQVVEGEDLLPLMRCLSELLVDANAQLFYSLYLALQRLHLTVGDQVFANYLRQCDPEATLLYKQAQSRHNSLAGVQTNQQVAIVQHHSRQQQQQQQHSYEKHRGSIKQRGDGIIIHQQHHSPEQTTSTSEPKQVTFENDTGKVPGRQEVGESEQEVRQSSAAGSNSTSSSGGSLIADTDNDVVTELDFDSSAGKQQQQQQQQDLQASSMDDENSYSSSLASSSTGKPWRAGGKQAEQAGNLAKQSSVSSTCSSEANLVDPAHYMTKAALSGRPLSGYEQIHHVDHSNTGLAINDLATSCSPTMELGPAAQNELKFGIFPRHLVGAALNSRYLDRMEALQEMMCIVRDSPINHLAILMTYFDSFLEQFLAPLMEPNTDYKVELIAIDMIETIVIKTKVSTMHYVRPMINLLVKTLGDSRTSIFRENSSRVIHKMMAFLPPQHVIDAIFEHKHHKNGLIREECINRITGAVLEYDRNEFNLTKLCYHVLPMLADQQPGVRLAALECIAALANALGQERIGSLLTAAEAVQTGCDYDGLLEAIHARLRRRTLPRCNADGSIRYVIKPFLNLANANFHQEHKAADVRWVLEAPSSHQQVTVTASGYLQHQAMFAGGSPLSPSLAQVQVHAHAHRPGVYSPPDLAQQRRCSVSLSQLAIHSDRPQQSQSHHHHHHHHPHPHHHHHQQQQHEQARRYPSISHEQAAGSNAAKPAAAETRRRSIATSPAAAAVATAEGCTTCTSPLDQSSSGQNQPSRDARKRSEANNRSPTGPNSNLSEISDSRQSSAKQNLSGAADKAGTTKEAGSSNGFNENANGVEQRRRKSMQQQQSGDRQLLTSTSLIRRSNSQESTSSTDTNKVLFQYYLGKFKTSLMEPGNGTIMHSVLPSDSIIYTDTVQAYSLSRHKSRQQQTSFDYDSDSVGRIPTVANPMKQNRQHSRQDDEVVSSYSENQQANNNNNNKLGELQQRQQLGDSSGSESPLTVMEADRRDLRGQMKQVRGESHEQKEKGGSKQSSKDEGSQTDEQSVTASRRKSISSSRQSDAELTGGKSSRRQSVASGGKRSVDHSSSVGNQDRRRKSTVTQTDNDDDDDEAGGGGDVEEHDKGEPDNQRVEERADFRPDQPSRRSDGSQNEESSRSNRRSLVRQGASSVSDAFTGMDVGARGSASSSASPNGPAVMEAGIQKQVAANNERTHSRRGSEVISINLNQRQDSQEAATDGSSRSETGEQQSAPPAAAQKEVESRRESRRRKASPSKRVDGAEIREELIDRRRSSRSQPPPVTRNAAQAHPATNKAAPGRQQLSSERGGGNNLIDMRRAVSVSPSVASNVNIRHILENVAQVEGAFQEPLLAFKVAIEAIDGPCWSTKVEGILALIRLASFHGQLVIGHLHEVIGRTAQETRNLRSTVARSAIFALGDFCAKLKRQVEPELETIVQALLQKSTESTAFIRDDIRRALTTMVEHLTQWRLANALIYHGANHKNALVRRMASQYIAHLVERMGAAKCLVGARDIGAQLIPVAAKFAQDSSPQTRYYGRLILSKLIHHGAFERLLRKYLTPNLYRTTLGIIESVKRRGTGDPPPDG